MKKDRSLSRRTERALLRLCLSALLAALSIVLGKYLSISTPLFRLSFENLPILMAGIFLGPLAGGIVGGVADLLGCVLVGYTINPIITLGGILVGVLVFELLKIILQFLGVDPNYNYIVQGLVVITAVAMDIRKYVAKK